MFATLGARMSAARSRLLGSVFTKAKASFVAGALTAMPVLTGEDFFEHKFVTSKNPEDIVDFYSTEDFLQILGVFPFAIHFVLAGVEWDLERENTMAVHNAMEISFTLTEREEETESGEKVVAFFQKEERFKNYIPFTKFLMWDQTQCFGYNRRDDGTCEVFHRGANFYGPLPIRLLVQLHSHYVVWATERHINSPAFGAADLEKQEAQRSNVPAYAFKDFVRRLYVAQKVALQSAKLAASAGTTEEAEKTLKQLEKLQMDDTEVYVKTLRKKQLKKQLSTIELSDPQAQKALDQAFSNLSKTKEGQAAMAAAVSDLTRRPEIEEQEARYGGAFKAKEIKGIRGSPQPN